MTGGLPGTQWDCSEWGAEQGTACTTHSLESLINKSVTVRSNTTLVKMILTCELVDFGRV